MICISTVYRFTVFIYFNLEFSGEENQGQDCYEENVTSEFRFSEVLLLLDFSGYYLSNIIKIPSNIKDPDLVPRTILRAHVRISWVHPIEGIPRYKLDRDSTEVSQE
jgi:hypothetical protein